MVELKPGSRFESTVCSTQVIVVKGVGDVDLTCGGKPMAPAGAGGAVGAPPVGVPGAAAGTLLGKRYGNEAETIEVLAIKAGDGSLAADGETLAVAQAKTLPASD